MRRIWFSVITNNEIKPEINPRVAELYKSFYTEGSEKCESVEKSNACSE